MPTGTVVKSTGSWFTVRVHDGPDGYVDTPCKAKGKLRLQGLTTTSPIAVGDIVDFDINEDTRGIIHTRHQRRNYMIRKATNLSRQEHVLATNMDQSAVVATLLAPRVSNGFIDRFLVTCEAYHVPGILVINKTDLYEGEPDLLERQAEWTALYSSLGYKVVPASATERHGLEHLRDVLRGKITLFSGHSGVGKSTLVNAMIPGSELKTGLISGYSLKGKHTTTFAEMVELPFGGQLIDTPGIKELGIVDIPNNELGHFFPEIKAALVGCKFYNCLHTGEPGCAVRQAVQDGGIAASRYASYLSILANEEHHR